MDLEETRAFLAVVDNGSFKAAAETVKQPRATLRRRVEALEARAGVPLLERSRTGVLPTAAGELLARQGRVMLRETTALLSALREIGDEPSGDIRVGVPRGLPHHSLAVIMSEFQARFPRTRLHLQVSDDPCAELSGRIDLALSFANKTPHGRWQQHALVRIDEHLAASRDYLQCHGIPQTPEDLDHHKLLVVSDDSEASARWPSRGGGGSFAVTPSMTTTEPELLAEFARLGCGIALLPAPPPEHSDNEVLIPVLEDHVGRRRELFVVYPDVASDAPKIRAFVEHLLASADLLHEQLETELRSPVGAGLQGLHSPAL